MNKNSINKNALNKKINYKSTMNKSTIKKTFKLWDFIKDLWKRFFDDDLLSTGAQATFFLLLSMFPFLIFLITLISYTHLGDMKDNIEFFSTFVPNKAYSTVITIVKQAVETRSGTLLPLGMILTFWASTSGATSLIRSINKAYDIPETRPWWKTLIISFSYTLELAIVIVISLVMIVFGKSIGIYLFEFIGISDKFAVIWYYTRNIFAFVVIILVFMSLYYIAPNRKMRFLEVLPGAIFSSFSWVIISIAFSFYANNLVNYTKVYGSLGGIIVLLLWIYISSIIIILGAEINSSLEFLGIGKRKKKQIKY